MAKATHKRKLIASLAVLLNVFFLLPQNANADTFIEALRRGQALEDQDDEEGAINAYVMAKSMAGNPYNDARRALARIYTKLGRYTEADAEYTAMLPATKDRQLRYDYGSFLINQGKFSNAITVWSDILAEDPKDSYALYHLASCYEGTESLDSAKEYYERAISVAPNTNVGRAAKDKLSRIGSAIDQRTKAKFFPIDSPMGEVGLGWWDLAKMPIHVYIDDGTGVSGYRDNMKAYIYRALENWHAASGGRFGFVIDGVDQKAEWEWKNKMGSKDPLIMIGTDPKSVPDDPIKSDIHVHWTDKLGGAALGLAWTDVYAENASKSSKSLKSDKDDDDEDGDDDQKKDLDKEKEPDKDSKSTTSTEKEKNAAPAKKKRPKKTVITHAHIWLITNSLADGSGLPEVINAANAAILEKQDRCMYEVTTHEFGHILGLPHATHPKNIMYPGIFALNSSDLLESRSLSNGDLSSLAEHYNNFKGHGYPDGEVTGDAPKTATINDGSQRAVSTENVKADRSETPPPVKASNVTDNRSKFADVLFELSTGNYSSSVEKLDKILSKEPKNATAHYLKAIALVKLRNYTAAQTEYKLVLQLVPNTELAKKADAGLSKIGK